MVAKVALVITLAELSIALGGMVHDGGPGSGNFGHKGRPGQVGGSGPGGGTVEGTNLPKVERPKSKYTAEERSKRAADTAAKINDRFIGRERVDNLEKWLSEAPDDTVDAMNTVVGDIPLRTTHAGASFYRAFADGSGKGEIYLQPFAAFDGEQPHVREMREFMAVKTMAHEYAHAIDDKNKITDTLIQRSSPGNLQREHDSRPLPDFQSASMQDAKDFLEAIPGNKYSFDVNTGAVIRQSDGKQVGRVPEDKSDERYEAFSKLNADVSSFIESEMGIKTYDEICKEHGVPKKVDYEDYFETYVTPKRKLERQRERFKGAGEKYRADFRNYREQMDKVIQENPNVYDQISLEVDKQREKRKLAYSFTDAIDSTVRGQLNLVYRFSAHDASYYGPGNKLMCMEVFSNWYAQRVSGEPVGLGLMEKYLPRTSKLFEQELSKIGKREG